MAAIFARSLSFEVIFSDNVLLTPRNVPVMFCWNNCNRLGEKVQKCDFFNKNDCHTRAHLPYCNADYSKVCLCEVWMDSVQQWRSKLLYKDLSGGASIASSKSNTYRSPFHARPNKDFMIMSQLWASSVKIWWMALFMARNQLSNKMASANAPEKSEI